MVKRRLRINPESRINYADAEERADVERVLSELPEDHPARVAWYSGDKTTIDVSHMLSEHPDLIPPLIDANLRGISRSFARAHSRAHMNPGTPDKK